MRASRAFSWLVPFLLTAGLGSPAQAASTAKCVEVFLESHPPLEENFNRLIEKKKSERLDPHAVRSLRDHAFLLVGGFTSDLPQVYLAQVLKLNPFLAPAIAEDIADKTVRGLGIYYRSMESVLRKDLQVTPTDIQIVRPSSAEIEGDRIVANAERMYEKVISLHQSSGKPVVVVGHSMGGPTILAMLAAHPELLTKNIVDRAIAIQGAFGGSYSVDHALAQGASRAMVPAMKQKIWGGTLALRHDRPNQMIAQALQGSLRKLNLEERTEFLHRLQASVFYVRSYAKNPLPSNPLHASWSAIKQDQSGTENDGLLSLNDQIPQIPTAEIAAMPEAYAADSRMILGREVGLAVDVDHLGSLYNFRFDPFTRMAIGFNPWLSHLKSSEFGEAFARAVLEPVGLAESR